MDTTIYLHVTSGALPPAQSKPRWTTVDDILAHLPPGGGLPGEPPARADTSARRVVQERGEVAQDAFGPGLEVLTAGVRDADAALASQDKEADSRAT